MEGNVNQGEVWRMIKRAFPILTESFQIPSEDQLTEQEFYQVVNVVRSLKLLNLAKLVVLKLESFVVKKVAVEFWSHFRAPIEAEFEEGYRQFYKAISVLFDYFTELSKIMVKVDMIKLDDAPIYNEETSVDALKLIIRAALLAKLPTDNKHIIENFYLVALKQEEAKNYPSEEDCKACLFSRSNCACATYFYETNRKLAILGLLEPMVEQVLTSLIYVYIESYIQKVCKDSFDVSHIGHLEKWLDSVVLNWLKKIYNTNTKFTMDPINLFIKKLTNYLYETYTKIQINQLFNIIIEYPESLPALEDLRTTLQKTDLRSLLTKKLQKAMDTRLLHVGVSTPDILIAYIAAIRSMRVLDPSGLLLETVTQPVHQYLRSRDDTVRCVVTNLTEEGLSDLAEEFVRSDQVPVDDNSTSDDENWETWMPDPVEAEPNKTVTNRRTSDIISMLVNVYGSRELFVNEYRNLLADRLLSQFSCDTEKEIRYLELLKLRFGEQHLHYCEVMLKDIVDSKRINQYIKQDPTYEEVTPMTAMIVSAQFWPPFKEEKLELHPKMEEQLDIYTKSFETLKGSRTLCWKNHLGVLDLEIELADRTLNLSVAPIYAIIIMHFQDRNEWILDDLSKVMQVPQTVLRRKIGFWQSHGVIAQTKQDVFVLVEEGNDRTDQHPSDIIVEEYESESAMTSTQDQREEELQTFWSYIVGMLMNLDSLPLERIHQMLKMFAFQGPTIECNLHELKVFLDRKVREHQLICTGGQYKLPKT